MRKHFPDYYQTRTEDDVDTLFEKALFSFDTNVLLELFVLSKDAREAWFKIIEAIKPERRWVTYQVAREYHSNVDDVIRKVCETTVSVVREKFKLGKQADLQSFISKNRYFLGQESNSVLGEFAEIFKTANDGLNKKANQLKREYLSESETIKERIADLFDGATGEPWAPERILSEHELSIMRRQQAIPPGYGDVDKKTNIGGDYFIWRQLMDKASDAKRPVVFVTNDTAKGDWFITRAQSKAKIPRSELRQEMMSVAKQEFMLFSFNEFFEEAKQRFSIEATKEVSDEVKNAGHTHEMALDGITHVKLHFPKPDSFNWFKANETLLECLDGVYFLSSPPPPEGIDRTEAEVLEILRRSKRSDEAVDLDDDQTEADE